MSENEEALFEVKDRFEITNRGIVLIPGIPAEADPPVSVGDPVTLRTPEGKEMQAKFKAL